MDNKTNIINSCGYDTVFVRIFSKKIFLFCILIIYSFVFSGCSKKNNEQQKPSDNPAANTSSELIPDTNAIALKANTEHSGHNQSPSANHFSGFASLLKKSIKSHKTADGETDLSNIENNNAERISNALDILSSDIESDEKVFALEELQDIPQYDLLPIIEKAMAAKESDVRLAAVSLLADMESQNTEEYNKSARQSISVLISTALTDNNENIRNLAFIAMENQPLQEKLFILKSCINSQYEEVKRESVVQLTDLSSPQAFEILILGLKDSDPSFKDEINFATDFLISKEFNSYDEAKQWWAKNKYRYDENLVELETEN